MATPTQQNRYQQALQLAQQAAALPFRAQQPFLAGAAPCQKTLVLAKKYLAELNDQDLSKAMASAIGAIFQHKQSAMVGRTTGAFQIKEFLTSTQQADCFHAIRIDAPNGPQYVLKLMHCPSDSRIFEHEVAVSKRFDDPQIVSYAAHGILEPEGLPYLVTEMVADALPFDQYCNQNQLSIKKRVQLLAKLCGPVALLHRNLLIHRDLKPDNVLITKDAANKPQVKLLDFGIAQKIQRQALYFQTSPTELGVDGMTRPFASPEQIRGEKLTTVSDVYSLGAMLQQTLCGSLPSEHTQPETTQPAGGFSQPTLPLPSQLIAAQIPSSKNPNSATFQNLTQICQRRGCITPRQLKRKLAGSLDHITAKAVAPDPGKRYASPLKLQEDLQHYLAGLPVNAHRGRWYRFCRYAGYYRQKIALASLVLMLLTAAVVNSFKHQTAVILAKEEASALEEFLSEAIQMADPGRNWGQPMHLDQILHRGAIHIEQGLTASPLAQQRLRYLWAKTWQNLGHFKASAALFQKMDSQPQPRFLLQKEARASYHLRACISHLGTANYHQAAIHLEQADAFKGGKSEVLQFFQSARQASRAYLLRATGNKSGAAALLTAELERLNQESQFGGETRQKVQIAMLHSLAHQAQKDGRFDAALRTAAKALSLAQAIKGLTPLVSAWFYSQKGVILLQKGQYHQALPPLAHAAAIAQSHLPPTHPFTRYCLAAQSLCLLQLNGLTEALATFKKIPKHQRQTFLLPMDHLGDWLFDSYSDALAPGLTVIKNLKKLETAHDSFNRDLANMLQGVALVFSPEMSGTPFPKGQYRETARNTTLQLAHSRHFFPENFFLNGIFELRLGQLALHLDHLEEAQSHLACAKGWFEQHQPIGSAEVWLLATNLAAAHYQSGDDSSGWYYGAIGLKLFENLSHTERHRLSLLDRFTLTPALEIVVMSMPTTARKPRLIPNLDALFPRDPQAPWIKIMIKKLYKPQKKGAPGLLTEIFKAGQQLPGFAGYLPNQNKMLTPELNKLLNQMVLAAVQEMDKDPELVRWFARLLLTNRGGHNPMFTPENMGEPQFEKILRIFSKVTADIMLANPLENPNGAKNPFFSSDQSSAAPKNPREKEILDEVIDILESADALRKHLQVLLVNTGYPVELGHLANYLGQLRPPQADRPYSQTLDAFIGNLLTTQSHMDRALLAGLNRETENRQVAKLFGTVEKILNGETQPGVQGRVWVKNPAFVKGIIQKVVGKQEE